MIGPLLDLIEAYWLIMIEQLSLKLSLSAPLNAAGAPQPNNILININLLSLYALNAAGAPQPNQFVHNYSI